MRRRDFIKGFVGSAAAWPLAVRAQQGDRMRRIGVLSSGGAVDDTDAMTFQAAFRQGLEQLGWTEGRNVQRVQQLVRGVRGFCDHLVI